MKNLDKLVAGLLVAFVGLVMVSSSHASVVARAPKDVALLNYTTVISSVTPFTVFQATSTVQDLPGAVYQITLSTGASGDYLVLFDTVPFNANLFTANANTQIATYQLLPRIFYSSTTQNTVITFDPPVIFYHGLMAIQSAATGSAAITYEMGRGLSGN